MNALNAKTVFVCDSRHSFIRKESQENIEFDVIGKNKQTPTAIIPLSSISKSLWTSTVEAIQEYSRVVWDIFPSSKAICFVTFDGNKEVRLNSWNEEEQNLSFFSNCFSKASMNAHADGSHTNTVSENNAVLRGLQAAVETLCVPSKIQEERRKQKLVDVNKGRIILISYFKSDSQIKMIAEFILDAVKNFNQIITSNVDSETTSVKLPLNELNLVIINTHPINESSRITEIPYHEISSNITCEVVSVKSGSFLASKLMSLVLYHYNLASTTVTGIPMKEEQNASSSANYDVELLHPSEAHIDL
ncbi:Protein asunder-like protein, partial [Leptotrombidium deliense]